jgi:hypothetical protein
MRLSYNDVYARSLGHGTTTQGKETKRAPNSNPRG